MISLPTARATGRTTDRAVRRRLQEKEHDALSDRTDPTSTERALVAARAADDKLGADTVVLDVGEVLSIVDWFVVTSAANPRQVRTIAEEVEAALKGAGGGPIRVEGTDDARWVLLDFGDLVVHVFLEEVRSYYELERLWSDVPRLDWRSGPPSDDGRRLIAND